MTKKSVSEDLKIPTEGLSDFFHLIGLKLQGIDSWDDIFKLGTKNINAIISIAETKKETVKLDEITNHLLELQKKATEKPYLMSLRPTDFFSIGDEVVVYAGQWHRRADKSDVWIPAVISYGYDHENAWNWNFETLLPTFQGSNYRENHFGWVERYRPEVLKKDDFLYLQKASLKDKDFFETWCSDINSKLCEFNHQRFVEDLTTKELTISDDDWKFPLEEISISSVVDAEFILRMYDARCYGTEKAIQDMANLQIKHIVNRMEKKSGAITIAYLKRQKKAIEDAKSLLVEKLREEKQSAV